MESEDFKYNFLFMKAVGFVLTPKHQTTSLGQLIWFCVTTLPFTLAVLLNIIKFPFLFDNLLLVTKNMITIVNGTVAVYRKIFVTIKMKNLKKLTTFIDRCPQFERASLRALERQMRAKVRARIRRITLVYVLHLAATAAMFVGLPVLLIVAVSMKQQSSGPRTPMYPFVFMDFWLPFNAQQATLNNVVLFWEVVTMVSIVANVSCINAFTCSLMVAAAGRAEMLALAAPTALTPAQDHTPDLEEGEVPILTTREATTSKECEMTGDFRVWFQCHQNYIRFVHEINKYCGASILLEYFMLTINIISIANRLINYPTVNKSILIAVLIMTLVEIYIYAYSGQQVIDKSVELGRAVLDGLQVSSGALGGGPARSALQLLNTRCSFRAEQISAMGYFTVSVEYFTTILSLSVSYLLILQNFSSN